MNKRKEESAKMKKRAQHMAQFGLPIQMWIADGQRKEVKRLANIQWEQLQKDIQIELDSAQKKEGIKKKSPTKRGRKANYLKTEEEEMGIVQSLQEQIPLEEEQESKENQTIDNQKTKKAKEKAKRQKKKNKKATDDNNVPFESQLQQDQEAQIDLLLKNDEGITKPETKQQLEGQSPPVKVAVKSKTNLLSIEQRMRLAQLKLQQEDAITNKSTEKEIQKPKKKKKEELKKEQTAKKVAPKLIEQDFSKQQKEQAQKNITSTPPRQSEKRKSPSISPVKSSLEQLREQTLEIINQSNSKKKIHKKKRHDKNNGALRMSMNAPLMTRNQKAVHFSPKTSLKTFHTNEVVSLKKILGSKFKKVPEVGIIKKNSKFS